MATETIDPRSNAKLKRATQRLNGEAGIILHRVKPYNTRNMPMTLHNKLDRLAFELKLPKEVVVNQALEVGVTFLEDAVELQKAGPRVVKPSSSRKGGDA